EQDGDDATAGRRTRQPWLREATAPARRVLAAAPGVAARPLPGTGPGLRPRDPRARGRAGARARPARAHPGVAPRRLARLPAGLEGARGQGGGGHRGVVALRDAEWTPAGGHPAAARGAPGDPVAATGAGPGPAGGAGRRREPRRGPARRPERRPGRREPQPGAADRLSGGDGGPAAVRPGAGSSLPRHPPGGVRDGWEPAPMSDRTVQVV